MNSTGDLAKKSCTPCKTGTLPLQAQERAELYRQLGNGWKIVDEHHLEKEYTFRNFRDALAFTNKVGEVAEQEKHHPDIMLSYGKVKILVWTHHIQGLSESDFILAAKCDQIP